MHNQDALPHSNSPVVGHRFLRLPAVCEMSGLSRSQIYRLQSAGQFPQGIKLGQSAIAWLEVEVAQWQADRIARSRQAAPKATTTTQDRIHSPKR
jgi:prophage regulatory protein